MTSSELFVVIFFTVTLGIVTWALTVALSYGIELAARGAVKLTGKIRESLAERRAQRGVCTITTL